jgi:hypothetical protein
VIAKCNWLPLTYAQAVADRKHLPEERMDTEAGIQVLPVMVALGNRGLAHRHGERRLRVRAELLRDRGPELDSG